MKHVALRIRKIFNEDVQLTVPWNPSEGDHHIRQHLSNLNIPTLDGKPSLLLHRLGDLDAFQYFEKIADRRKTLATVFSQGTGAFDNKHSVLFNTSGAGKTRLVLDGLSQEWGLYFTCSRSSSQCGSADMENLLQNKYGYLRACGIVDEPTSNEEIKANERHAERCFSAILTARLLVFQCFLCVYEDRMMLQKDRKRDLTIPYLKHAWLLLQLDPHLLSRPGQPDLLLELTTLFCHVRSYSVLTLINNDIFDQCMSFLKRIHKDARFYCVLDEAQTAATAFPSAFRCHRPALRAMLHLWVGLGMRHVTTGTSLQLECISEALTSSVGKPTVMNNSTITATGSFIEKEDQIASYLRYYLPESYINSDSGDELITRANPRFVASYVTYLLENTFQHPHWCLTRYIEAIADFTPTDAEYWQSLESTKPPEMNCVQIHPFDLTRANALEPKLIDAVQKLSHYRILSGDLNFDGSALTLLLERFRSAPVKFPFCAERDSLVKTECAIASPSKILGYKPNKDPEDDLLWLNFRINSPFLFPDEKFGPDLLFRLELEATDQLPASLITVALQVKLRSELEGITRTSDITSAINSVSPSWFWRNKNGSPYAPRAHEDLPGRTLTALDRLPDRFSKDVRGYHSVLRGLFVYPAISKGTATNSILGKLNPHHITADAVHEFFVIPLETLENLTNDMEPRRALQRIAGGSQNKNRRDTADVKRTVGNPYLTVETMTQPAVASRICSNLKELKKLSSMGLDIQLKYHRRWEEFAWKNRKAGVHETPLSDGMTDEEKLNALVNAVNRFCAAQQMASISNQYAFI
ncbi:hypothetical protein H0H87_010069 [Tephrocybe sp. NHM501043]|nr:hypothetical protein H0H87_010069 [Tephrocybe sp. NHM501043]